MPEGSTFMVFLGSALLILLIPGPAVVFIMARSVDQGRVAGVVSALGLGVGNFVHVLAAVVGLSAIVASSAIAFSVVKYLGAAYLIVLGIRRLTAKQVDGAMDVRHRALWQIFRQGIVVNVLNPKVALFFLAFLPQFIDPAKPVALQVFVLGSSLAVLGVVTDTMYGLVLGTVGIWLRRSARAARVERYVSGGTYIALGVGGALTGSANE